MSDSHVEIRSPLNRSGQPYPGHGWLRTLISHHADRLEQRSRAVPFYFERNMGPILVAWLLIAGALLAMRASFPATPWRSAGDLLPIALQYGAILLAPVLGYVIGSGSFPRGLALAQPRIRLCRYGKWRSISPIDARADTSFGPSGFMASLLVGLLLNVVVRSFEFILAMPALGPAAPAWADQLALLMSGDVAIMGFFYSVCFVAALRASPYFPRLLLLAWLLDINIQLQIARLMGAAHDLPTAVSEPLQNLLVGNEKKVFISVIVWLPYLIISARVNRTYRMRVRDNF